MRRIVSSAVVICLGMVLVGSASGEPRTVLKRKGHPPELVERVIYLPSKGVYRISSTKATVTIAGSEVDYVKPPKPAGLDQMSGMEELEGVYSSNAGFIWAEEAFKKLMPLYVEKSEFNKAISLYERMVKMMGRDMPVAVTYQYWQALLGADRKATLKKKLGEAMAGSSRERSAWAFMMMGDILKSEGNPKEALVDGYLKAALMFDDIRSCRRDVLSKTQETMVHLGDSRSDKFRKMLAEEFPRAERKGKRKDK